MQFDAGGEYFALSGRGSNGANRLSGVGGGFDCGEECDVVERWWRVLFERAAIGIKKEDLGAFGEDFSEGVELCGVFGRPIECSGGLLELLESVGLVLFESFAVEGRVKRGGESEDCGRGEEDVESGDFPEEFGVEPRQGKRALGGSGAFGVDRDSGLPV
ncbi:MAG: hypothetical protein RL215_1489 [Planctomycetota bacterium]